VAPEQYDLEDTRALARPGRILGRAAELLEDDLDDAFKLALFGGRKMIKIGAHVSRIFGNIAGFGKG
jgi:hypothetical protein